MSSIWNSASASTGTNPFTMVRTSPMPGGGSAAMFQSLLQPMGETKSPSAQPVSGVSSLRMPGLAPTTGSAAKTLGVRSAVSEAAGATSSPGTANASDSAAAITANDFLTLLVTEMQNQDPTSQTDPNEYIDQLTQINSLEQLISINQNLAEVLGAATSPVTPTTPTDPTTSGPSPSFGGPSSVVSGLPGGPSMPSLHAQLPVSAAQRVGGNLGIPATSPAAHAVGHALDGHTHRTASRHGPREIPMH